jgi:AcrR family transcriptional regulator
MDREAVTNSDPDATPRRGRPRNDAIDEAAVQAALDLLAEGGVPAVTMDAVARRAGTTPPALYRRWSNAEDLLWTAMRRLVLTAANRRDDGPPYSTDGLPFDQALQQTMRRCAAIYGDRQLAASYLAVAAAARTDPATMAGFEDFQAASREPLIRLIQAPADAAGVSARLVVDLVVGVVIYRIIISGAPPTPEEIDGLARLVAAGCAALARERGVSPP